MVDQHSARVQLPRARTGRPRPSQVFAPEDLVRIELRVPASTATLLYAAAGAQNLSVSQLADGLFIAALSTEEAPTTAT